MSTITLSILLMCVVFGELFFVTKNVKKNAYQWWYTPWMALLYTIIVYLAYHFIDLPKTFLLKWLYEDYIIETFYSIACMLVWFPIQMLLRQPKVHKPLLALYRKLFANENEESTKLPFPYYATDDQTVKSRVGRLFYQLTLKTIIIIITIIYAIALIVAYFYPTLFFVTSAFGILALIPLTEYFLYLSAEVEEEQETATGGGEPFHSTSNLDHLWQLYVDNYDNYSVAWKRDYDIEGTKQNTFDKNNIASFKALYDTFKEEHKGGVIEDCDLLTAFSKLVPFFMQVIKEGHYILVVFDVPNHFASNKDVTYIENIANQLKTVLVKRFPQINEIIKFKVYDEKSTLDVFDNSIVMSPLSVLTRQDIKNKEWMRNLGLITVVNVFDKGVSNLYENRRFSHLLKAINNDYQILVISSFRKDLEASLEQTWVTTQEKHFPDGCKMILYPRGNKQYFLGYNFEDYQERFDKVLSAQPNESLYSGSEMLVFPLTSRIEKEQKVVTPVHQLDLAYTNALEGNEEIRKFLTYFKERYSISTEDIIQKTKAHVLPTDEIEESHVLSVIYDNENNAPAAYMKWIHLGSAENLSIVISKPYLFRDYFNANHYFFTNAPFTALQPCMCKSRITLAIILLDMLKDGEKDESIIKHHLLKYYNADEIVSVPDKLKELFSTYFTDDLANDLRTRDEVVFDGAHYQSNVKFRLVHPDRINLPYLDVITVRDENGNVLFDILKDLLYQNYNKGQHHSFSGYPYTITDFDQINKILTVKRSHELTNELFSRPCYYVNVNLNDNTMPIKGLNMKEPIEIFHDTGIEMAYLIETFETNVDIEPQKWVTFEKRYEAPKYSAGSSKIVPIDHDVTPNRSYNKGKVLKLSLKYLPKYSSRIEDVRKMMQILIYEGLQSLFPHHSQYLILTSLGSGDPYLPWIFHEFNCNDTQKDGWLSFYFIEDAHVDLGLIGALTYDNIKYLMRYIFDYLMWLTEENIFPDGYIEYRNRSGIDKLAFLKYGRNELPEYFDIDLAINFIRDQFTNSKDESLTQMQQKRQENNRIIGCCDFCKKMMKNSEMQRLDDGRMRCPECSKDAIDSREQFQQLCDKVKDAFKTHLNIDFNNITYRARLVSAVELHKAGGYSFSITNGYDVRKAIGIAFDTKEDEFIVENGYKYDKTFGIIAHEMTHIWEYNDENFSNVRKTNEDLVEGLAVWTDLFLSEKNGITDIEEQRKGWLARDDEYGRGLRFIMTNCPENPYDYIRTLGSQ